MQRDVEIMAEPIKATNRPKPAPEPPKHVTIGATPIRAAQPVPSTRTPDQAAKQKRREKNKQARAARRRNR